MLGGLGITIVLYLLTVVLLMPLKKGRPWLKLSFLHGLFWYHMAFGLIYYLMVQHGRSDSFGYYNRPLVEHTDFLSTYTTGTQFIDFLAYPWVSWFGFSFEMTMALFTWVGYWGFVYFYLFFKENITFKHNLSKSIKIDLITLFVFLPNMHFWTASLGKGSVIFLGLGLAMYGLSKITSRKLLFVLGLAIVYHVRPHIFLFMVIGIIAGLFTGRQKIPTYQKVLVLVSAIATLAVMYNTIISFVGLDSENLTGSFEAFSEKRSADLAGSNSGIDISNYPLPLKLFTFWFRPLFIDSPGGPSGMLVSFENLLYLYFATLLFNKNFLRFVKSSSALVKTSAIVFLVTSLAMAQTLSNMGIIVRQKSSVMYFFLFVIIAFLDFKKSKNHKAPPGQGVRKNQGPNPVTTLQQFKPA